MKAAKFSPRPTGSMIVNRTFPGGIEVRNRSISDWSSGIAWSLPASAARMSTEDRIGKGINAGRSKCVGHRLEPGVDRDAVRDTA